MSSTSSGVGAGVYDRLVGLGIPAVPYCGGEAPFDKERFVNARAKDYGNLREIFETKKSTPGPSRAPR
jgi:hypothetical protein